MGGCRGGRGNSGGELTPKGGLTCSTPDEPPAIINRAVCLREKNRVSAATGSGEGWSASYSRVLLREEREPFGWGTDQRGLRRRSTRAPGVINHRAPNRLREANRGREARGNREVRSEGHSNVLFARRESHSDGELTEGGCVKAPEDPGAYNPREPNCVREANQGREGKGNREVRSEGDSRVILRGERGTWVGN